MTSNPSSNRLYSLPPEQEARKQNVNLKSNLRRLKAAIENSNNADEDKYREKVLENFGYWTEPDWKLFKAIVDQQYIRHLYDNNYERSTNPQDIFSNIGRALKILSKYSKELLAGKTHQTLHCNVQGPYRIQGFDTLMSRIGYERRGQSDDYELKLLPTNNSQLVDLHAELLILSDIFLKKQTALADLVRRHTPYRTLSHAEHENRYPDSMDNRQGQQVQPRPRTDPTMDPHYDKFNDGVYEYNRPVLPKEPVGPPSVHYEGPRHGDRPSYGSSGPPGDVVFTAPWTCMNCSKLVSGENTYCGKCGVSENGTTVHNSGGSLSLMSAPKNQLNYTRREATEYNRPQNVNPEFNHNRNTPRSLGQQNTRGGYKAYEYGQLNFKEDVQRSDPGVNHVRGQYHGNFMQTQQHVNSFQNIPANGQQIYQYPNQINPQYQQQYDADVGPYHTQTYNQSAAAITSGANQAYYINLHSGDHGASRGNNNTQQEAYYGQNNGNRGAVYQREGYDPQAQHRRESGSSQDSDYMYLMSNSVRHQLISPVKQFVTVEQRDGFEYYRIPKEKRINELLETDKLKRQNEQYRTENEHYRTELEKLRKVTRELNVTKGPAARPKQGYGSGYSSPVGQYDMSRENTPEHQNTPRLPHFESSGSPLMSSHTEHSGQALPFLDIFNNSPQSSKMSDRSNPSGSSLHEGTNVEEMIPRFSMLDLETPNPSIAGQSDRSGSTGSTVTHKHSNHSSSSGGTITSHSLSTIPTLLRDEVDSEIITVKDMRTMSRASGTVTTQMSTLSDASNSYINVTTVTQTNVTCVTVANVTSSIGVNVNSVTQMSVTSIPKFDIATAVAQHPQTVLSSSNKDNNTITSSSQIPTHILPLSPDVPSTSSIGALSLGFPLSPSWSSPSTTPSLPPPSLDSWASTRSTTFSLRKFREKNEQTNRLREIEKSKSQALSLVRTLRRLEGEGLSAEESRYVQEYCHGSMNEYREQIERVQSGANILTEEAECGQVSNREASQALIEKQNEEMAMQRCADNRLNQVERLKSKGLKKEDAVMALTECSGNVDKALTRLVNHQIGYAFKSSFTTITSDPYYSRLRRGTHTGRIRLLIALKVVDTEDLAMRVLDFLSSNPNQSLTWKALDAVSQSLQANTNTSPNSVSKECSACSEKFVPLQLRPMIMCECSALFCDNCLKRFLHTAIRNNSVTDIVCPFCHKPQLQQSDKSVCESYFQQVAALVRKLLGTDSDTYKLFDDKLLSWNMGQSTEDIHVNCSNDRCTFAAFVEHGNTVMECPTCKTQTCVQCKRKHDGSHRVPCTGNTGASRSRRLNRTLSQSLSHSMVECPNASCGEQFEVVDGGCIHITCPKCAHEFCQICRLKFSHADCVFRDRAHCENLGLHCHHPRNCLFYLRDTPVSKLQQLLKHKKIDFVVHRECSSHMCRVLQQKRAEETQEEPCGKPAHPEYASLCEDHYKVYLATLITKYSVDTIPIMDDTELERVLKNWGFVPNQGASRTKMLEMARQHLPLVKENPVSGAFSR